jgi:peptide/nickel transport system permease protein
VSALAEPAVEAPTSSARSLLRRPVAVSALVFLAVLVAACLAAPLLAPDDPRAQDLVNALHGPSSAHLLGADTLGRDVLSRLLYGGRRSLLSIAEALAVVLAVGVPLGLVAGYRGGRADRLLSRIGEIVLSVPAIVIVLVVLAVVPRNEDVAMAAFALLGVPAVFRVVRGAALRVREEPYVAAARVAGLTHPRIVVRHILPRALGPIIVQASVFCAYALLFETGLAYLGLTADPGTPTWGGMVAEAASVIETQSWLLIPSGTIIALTILACGLLGDAVRDTATRESPRPARSRRRPAGGARLPPDGTPRALLEVRDLTVSVRRRDGGTGVRIVDGVSFEVQAGETVALVGESGCGKSVTALALLRLLPTALHVSGGRVLWSGRPISAVSDRAFDALRGKALGFVSQEPQASLDPTFRIGSQLTEVIRHHWGASRSGARRRAVELLGQVELPDPEAVFDAHAHELSGGMAQRVAIALALAGRPQLLVADEPTTALDVTVQRDILALLRRIQADTGMAVLLITHDWGVVADLCDRALVMYAGQIVEAASIEAVFDAPEHPYTVGLLSSHPAHAVAGRRLGAMVGSVPAPGNWPHGCRFAPRCAHVREECRVRPIALREPEAGHLARCVRVEELLGEGALR